jgi:hypothetical protein
MPPRRRLTIQCNPSPIPAGYDNDVDGAQTVHSF